MEAGRRLHLTSYALEKPLVPPVFCMALRKYLRGAWLLNIEQYEFERIVILQFKTRIGIMRLILELFGEGNVILTDEKEEILQALTLKRMRDRNILHHEVFKFPPSSGKNPFKVTAQEFESALKSFGEDEIVRALTRYLAVGGTYAEEILLRANIEKNRKCNTLSDQELQLIFDELQGLLATVLELKIEPRIILSQNGDYLDAVPFNLKRYNGFIFKSYRSYNETLDEFYLRETAIEKAIATPEAEKLRQEAEKLQRIIANQEQAIQKDQIKAEQEKNTGDIIYERSPVIQDLMSKFAEAKKEGKDWKLLATEIIAAKTSEKNGELVVESFDQRNLALILRIDNKTINLNLRKTLYENAADYYERGKKAKWKADRALLAVQESRERLSKIQKRLLEDETLKTIKPIEVLEELAKRKVKKKEWFEKFRWFISSDDTLVVAGRDATSNEVLVKKHVDQQDPVFHADVSGSPFVVVKTEGKMPSEQTLQEAGEFAAAFSRAWREGVGSADVYWVQRNQLSKAGPSGEYVTRGAFAVTGKRNWIRNVVLRLAVGVLENNELEFIGGPIESVKAKTKNYVTLMPGNWSGKELLKRILNSLALKLPKEQREKVQKTSIERIRQFVPYTKAKIMKEVS